MADAVRTLAQTKGPFLESPTEHLGKRAANLVLAYDTSTAELTLLSTGEYEWQFEGEQPDVDRVTSGVLSGPWKVQAVVDELIN